MHKNSRVKSDNDLISVSLERSLGCASDDDGAKRYQNSAALRSFDSVLLFQISHFLTYDFFLRSG